MSTEPIAKLMYRPLAVALLALLGSVLEPARRERQPDREQ